MELLNQNDLSNSFFCLSKDDPTIGFEYDASKVFGPTFPKTLAAIGTATADDEQLSMRLCLGSHLARHLRHGLESHKGYTSTVGIATNKILSKLAGNLNKPKNQTTITPPYEPVGQLDSNVTQFLDTHDIGKIPGIGFKLAHKIRSHVLGRAPDFDRSLVYGGTKESVTVLDVRSHPGMGPELLEEIIGGPGSPKGIGGKVWELIHGIDDSEVGKTKRVPSQISQEDSYMKYLHTFEQVKEQLSLLSERLIQRMHMDLLEDDDDGDEKEERPPRHRWVAHPRTLRLSTRPRPPPGPDGTRARISNRISRSGPMPNFIFSLNEPPVVLAERLVEETLIPMFRKLHHETNGWNLSLINIAATNMAETAAETKDSEGRDIGKMFRQQDEVLKDFKVTVESDEINSLPSPMPKASSAECTSSGMDALNANLPSDVAEGWDSEDSDSPHVERCVYCQACVPVFALAAHHRYHELSN
jgi:DNA polymerase iota